MVFVSPIVFDNHHAGSHMSFPLIGILFLIIPLIYSLFWIGTKKFRMRAILAVVAALIGATLVTISQFISIALNILKRLTTSLAYEGKMRYLRITPY